MTPDLNTAGQNCADDPVGTLQRVSTILGGDDLGRMQQFCRQPV